MSCFFCVSIGRLCGGMSGMLGRLWLRLTLSSLIRIVTSLLGGGSGGRRLQPMDDHPTRAGSKDQRACEQDRSDHTEAAAESAHHVTNLPTRPRERKVDSTIDGRAPTPNNYPRRQRRIRPRTQREEVFMRRTLHIGLSLVAVSVLMLATAGTSSAQAAGAHAMGVKGAHAAHHRGSTLLSSHGGAIQTTPVVFITYSAASWSAGFSTGR